LICQRKINEPLQTAAPERKAVKYDFKIEGNWDKERRHSPRKKGIKKKRFLWVPETWGA